MVALGIDLGRKRVGLALSDPSGTIASPLQVIEPSSPDDLLCQVARLVEERSVDTVVVGLPKNMDGSLGPKAQEALAFAEDLKSALACAVVTWDERLTTAQAERAMIQADLSRAKRKKRIDALAAQLMLQAYLDAQKTLSKDPPDSP